MLGLKIPKKAIIGLRKPRAQGYAMRRLQNYRDGDPVNYRNIGPVNYRHGDPMTQQSPTSQQLLQVECMTLGSYIDKLLPASLQLRQSTYSTEVGAIVILGNM